MKFEIIADDKTPIERRIQVRVDSESIEQLWEEELTRAVKQTTLDGFREGKAPKHLVERHIGRPVVWQRVSEMLKHKVESELIRNADPKPLAPPKSEISTNADDNGDAGVWEKGQDIELTVNYLLPPPTPEEIERDLMRGVGIEKTSGTDQSANLPGPHSTLPPDPRMQIPGSGVLPDPTLPSGSPPDFPVDPTQHPDPEEVWKIERSSN